MTATAWVIRNLTAASSQHCSPKMSELGPSSFGRTVRLSAVLGIVLISVVTASAAEVEDDDDRTIDDVGTSVPAEVLRAKRSQAEREGFSVLGGVSTFWGEDDNLYQSPPELAERGRMWGSWGYLRTDSRVGANRFLNTVKFKQEQYPGHWLIDAAYLKSSNWFTRPLTSTIDLELDLDVSHQNDASANIAGRDYAQDYGYWRYAGETVLEWKPSSRHRVRLGAERVIKDYEETPGLVSVDWTQWMASASYRVRLIGGQSASASYATGYRDYKDEPAAESSGRELPTNPAERHRYRELALKYSIPLTRRADLEVGYSRDSKEDLFQGYESRRSEGFHAEVGVEALPGVELRLAGARSWRDYQHILADAGRPLSYRLQEASVGSRVHVLAPTWVFFQLSYFERDTNKSTGTLYRDHTGTVTRTGVNVFF